MFNRYINVRKDFYKMNEYENKIKPMVSNAKFKTDKEKELVLEYLHEIFFNQWKKRKINEWRGYAWI